MVHKIIAATGNRDKVREFRELAGDLPVEILSLKDIEFTGEIVETGTSFAENARIKARSVWEQTGGLVFADDSGLAIDALDGFPGIYSARFMGEDAPYDLKCAELNRMLDEKGVPQEERTARFVCAIAAVFPDGHEELTEADVEGLIIREMRGRNGFGYDPVFYVPEFGCTTAEMSEEQKNLISHRGLAFVQMIPKIREWLEKEESAEG